MSANDKRKPIQTLEGRTVDHITVGDDGYVCGSPLRCIRHVVRSFHGDGGGRVTPNEKAAYEAVRIFQLAMRRHRQEAGLSFGKWAPLIGMRKQALQRMESHQTYNPSLAQADRIARFFGKTLGEFLSYETLDNVSVAD